MLRPIETVLIMAGVGMLACPAAGLGAEPAAGEPGYYAPGIDLPAGEGRDLILRACTRCHDLKGVPAYKGYWNFERWLPMVENMIEHGAKLNDREKIIVAQYLADYYGTNRGSE